MRMGYWAALPETAWRPDIEGVGSSGDCGGDIQRGDSYTIRFTRPDVPTARVRVIFYAVEYDECPGEFIVRREVEFLVGEDPENLGVTEIWERTDSDDLSDEVMDTQEEAEAEARRLAATAAETGDDINWDGEPWADGEF
jgi:hypothetical protein